MRGNANTSALDSSGDGVESGAKVRPVGQLVETKINVRMVDNRSKRGRQTVASNAGVSAMLNDAIGDNKVVEDTVTENADGVSTGQRQETGQGHSLELVTLLGKNVGDAAECELHGAYPDTKWNGVKRFFSNINYRCANRVSTLIAFRPILMGVILKML